MIKLEIKNFLKKTGISFVIRGHQDSDANTVIGNQGTNMDRSFNRRNMTDVIIQQGYDIQEIYDVPEATASHHPDGEIAYININGVVEKNNLYDYNNVVQDDNVNIITISNNADNKRFLLRDSYVILHTYENSPHQVGGKKKQNRKSNKKQNKKSNKKQNKK